MKGSKLRKQERCYRFSTTQFLSIETLFNESSIFQQMGLMRQVWKIWAEREKGERASYDWRISGIISATRTGAGALQ